MKYTTTESYIKRCLEALNATIESIQRQVKSIEAARPKIILVGLPDNICQNFHTDLDHLPALKALLEAQAEHEEAEFHERMLEDCSVSSTFHIESPLNEMIEALKMEPYIDEFEREPKPVPDPRKQKPMKPVRNNHRKMLIQHRRR